jgi:chitinase
MSLFADNWDATAKVPYLTGLNGLNTFVSYDNEQSIELKAQYIVEENLRGAIIWEITGDYIETSPGSGVILGTPLVDKLNHVLCNYSPQDPITGIVENDIKQFKVYPNPTKNEITVQFDHYSKGALTIVDFYGKILKTVKVNHFEMSLNLDFLSNGSYFVVFTSDNGTISRRLVQKF